MFGPRRGRRRPIRATRGLSLTTMKPWVCQLNPAWNPKGFVPAHPAHPDWRGVRGQNASTPRRSVAGSMTLESEAHRRVALDYSGFGTSRGAKGVPAQ
jgi:hypothetical protein